LAGNRVITACYTGDIGHFDEDGFVFITDRKKDVVFVKGFNVLPREVEEVIHTHPKVGTVGVVGVPDARTGGERLVAFVVPRTGKSSIRPNSPRTARHGWSTTSARTRCRWSGSCRLRPLTSWTAHCGRQPAASRNYGPVELTRTDQERMMKAA
jgi:acyl-CoA synthetase (AMP-forming)/AMP-acid ligase II